MCDASLPRLMVIKSWGGTLLPTDDDDQQVSLFDFQIRKDLMKNLIRKKLLYIPNKGTVERSGLCCKSH